ncbi:SLATT domain-containing protein [Galbibacter sp.]|uniref:SLATT domain-containing protein n=1 Tax=Galbibacter sp. TaxID=2918471 RepID=UPI002C45FB5D|nr:SLATT domain-containing protein [Galbibacter sp.]HLV63918.1 SLATT domain-containing protein [Galbibacter sp.]
MDFRDFPNYFQTAANTAVRYQGYYKTIKRSAVLLLVLAVVVALFTFDHVGGLEAVYGIVGLLLALSLILALILQYKNYDQIAQNILSLKASCKSVTWQFIMGAGEFSLHTNTAELKLVFENRIKRIAESFEELGPQLTPIMLKQQAVTPKMLALREASFEFKKNYYAEKRIRSLYDHYFKKAIEHHQKYKLWFLNLIMAQIFALIATSFLFLDISQNWSIIALVTMLLSSIVSWLELPRNLEKKQHYTLRSKELEIVQRALDDVALESELADFVKDTEKLISGPHAFWLIPGAERDRQEILI